jgi:hypothetical protein
MATVSGFMNDKLAMISFYPTNTPSKSLWVMLLIIFRTLPREVRTHTPQQA